MALQAEQTVGEGVIALFLEQRNSQKFALGLAHFAGVCVQMQNVHPVVAPLVAEVGLGLSDLVGVMRKSVVDAAAVNVKVFAEVLHGYAGAFNMPAGIADTPG